MRDALKSYLALAAGVTDITRQRALSAAKALVSQGEATAEQVTGLAEDLVVQTRQNREAVVALVSFEVDRALGRLGLATADEVTQLTDRIRELEGQLRQTRGAAAAGPAAQPAKTGAAGEASGMHAAAGSPKKTAGANAPGKAAAGRAAAKAPATAPGKAAGGKAPAKKSPGAAAKKAPAKTAPARKAPAREPGESPA